jgi:hypothetical protein
MTLLNEVKKKSFKLHIPSSKSLSLSICRRSRTLQNRKRQEKQATNEFEEPVDAVGRRRPRILSASLEKHPGIFQSIVLRSEKSIQFVVSSKQKLLFSHRKRSIERRLDVSWQHTFENDCLQNGQMCCHRNEFGII